MHLAHESTHKERLALAEELFSKLMHEKQDTILAVGLYGSMAKHTDHAFSDIEFDVIPKKDGVNYSVSEIFKGIKYELCYISKDILLENIRNPGNIYWPEIISASLTAKPFYDPTGVFDELRNEYERIIQTDFKPFYKQLFVEGIYETMCKFIKAAQHDDASAVRFYAYHYLFDELICFIAILNKTYIINAATRGKDSLNMPINFDSYKVFAKLLLEGNIKDVNVLIGSALEVFKDLEMHIKSEGIDTESQELII